MTAAEKRTLISVVLCRSDLSGTLSGSIVGDQADTWNLLVWMALPVRMWDEDLLDEALLHEFPQTCPEEPAIRTSRVDKSLETNDQLNGHY